MAIGTHQGKVLLWDIVDQQQESIDLITGNVTQLAFSGDATTVLAIQETVAGQVGIANVLRKEQGTWIRVEIRQSANDAILAGDLSG